MLSRLSGLLAEHFKEVFVTDFMEKFVAKNMEVNNLPNTKHQVVDATKMDCFAPESFDVVFSNWLLMYISSGDLQKFAKDVLRLVRY